MERHWHKPLATYWTALGLVAARELAAAALGPVAAVLGPAASVLGMVAAVREYVVKLVAT